MGAFITRLWVTGPALEYINDVNFGDYIGEDALTLTGDSELVYDAVEDTAVIIGYPAICSY